MPFPLVLLNSKFAFEVAVGVNGTVWIRGRSTRQLILIRNAILNAEMLTDTQAEAMVDIISLSNK